MMAGLQTQGYLLIKHVCKQMNHFFVSIVFATMGEWHHSGVPCAEFVDDKTPVFKQNDAQAYDDDEQAYVKDDEFQM